MTKLRNLQSFSEIYFDDSQYIKIVKARVPQELTEKCLDIAKQTSCNGCRSSRVQQ